MNCLEIVEFTIFKGFSSNDSEEMESENISKNTNIRWIKKAEKKNHEMFLPKRSNKKRV